MNNGNLLNSLLGITGANPAVTKATAAKTRAESTDKFQQALEQVRPEVAARKPVARRDSPAAESSNTVRPAPKPSVQRDSPPDMQRTKAPTSARENADSAVVVKAAGKSDSSACDLDENKPVESNQSEEPAADAQHQALTGEIQTSESTGEVPLLAMDTLLSADDVVMGELDAVLETPENILNPISAQPLVVGEPANEDDIELSLTPAPEDQVVLDPSLIIMPPVVPVVTEAVVDAEGDSLPPLLAGAQVALGQAANSSSVTGSAAAPLLAAQAASSALVGQSFGEALAETDPEADVLAADTDIGENPDFLLLNSKAAMNKLAETTLTTLDKAAPAVDLAKPAAVSAAVETLTRLTEAQSPAARAFVVQTGVPVPVGTPQWSQAVGDKVLWLAAQNVSAAEIRLDPPELGPMQVKVSVNQDQASVTFTSPHPAVREALDQQLNRLREMFSEQGLNLVNVDVSDKSFTQREQEESAKHKNKADGDEEEVAPVAVSQAISMRLVDHYA